MAAEAEAAREARAKVYIELWQLKQKQLGKLELRYIYRLIELWQLKLKKQGKLELRYI